MEMIPTNYLHPSSVPSTHRVVLQQVLEVTLQDRKYDASSVQEWSDAICSQTLAALRSISGSFKYTGTSVHCLWGRVSQMAPLTTMHL